MQEIEGDYKTIVFLQATSPLRKKNDIDKSVIDVYISLFFEINKKISNFRLYDLDSLQTLNTIRYIFIKHSENLNK